MKEDPSHDLLHDRRRPLDSFFRPQHVALIGASSREGSVGRTILENLIRNPFGGTVYPVNPNAESVLGIRAYPALAQVPGPVDLAVVATPARSVPGVIRECVEAGVRGAIVISAGFRETGEAGARLEEEVLTEARRGDLRIVGPNCLGVMCPPTGLNATFGRSMARPGGVAFVSQSGALLTSILDWSLREHVGFSAFVSVGSMLDVGWGDLISYLGDDPKTESILLYMESIGDARAFLSAAREVALRKPIIVIKSGRTDEAAKAAASHTGTLAGSDEVLTAAFRRAGVLRVDSIADLFYMAEVLAKQPRPRGRRLTILTNAGGPGVLATDALVAGDGELAPLSEETRAALDEFLPAHWSGGNPVDILGDADAERFRRAAEIVARDPDSDGLLVTMVPVGTASPTEVAEQMRPYARLNGKPILACWMGGADMAAGDEILSRAGIPTVAYPDTAARLFNYMWQYSRNLEGLYETPVLHEGPDDGGPERVRTLIAGVRAAGRTLLTEAESKQLLVDYGIPTVETHVAADVEQAVALAEQIGYPVVLKLHSYTITHKTDVGGVQLNLGDADAVRGAYAAIRAGAEAATDHQVSASPEGDSRSEARAGGARVGGGRGFAGVTVQPMVRVDGYELILGSSPDPQFGPVLLFGSGGQLVEVYRDRSLGLPPQTTTLARRMIERTRISKALLGVRGRPPVDMEALEGICVRFSQLVVEQPAIREIEINPLIASDKGLIALDARVILYPADVPDAALPRPAIRPYPRQYAGAFALKTGEEVTIRPIRPEDEPLLVAFHEKLSEESVYLRYAGTLHLERRVAHERLARLCFIDYDREMALVAVRDAPAPGSRPGEAGAELLGVGRLTRLHGTDDAEFALLIRDDVQGNGLGTELLRRLVDIGRREGVARIVGDVLAENHGMQSVARDLGFRIVHNTGDSMVKAVLVADDQSVPH